MNKLVTFGDSFLAQRVYYKELEPTSWIDMVCQKNNFTLDGYGDAATGPYNAIFNFLNYREDLDICFFSWSYILRAIYNNRKLIDIVKGKQKEMDISGEELTELYHKYFFSTDEFEWVKAQAMLEWFDRHLQKNYKDKKFIHFYCFEINHKGFYPHMFEHGINIKPCLNDFSNIGDKKEYKNNDPRLLHMIPKVHKLFAKQLNKVLKDKSLNNGDVVEFSLEI